MVNGTLKGNLLVPQTYSPVNGNLNIQFHYYKQQLIKNAYDNGSEERRDDGVQSKSEFNDIRLQITRYDGTDRTTVGAIDVYPDPRLNVTQVTIPCQKFLYGGLYELEIVGNEITSSIMDNPDERLRQQLDVRWPQPKISVTPDSIGTFPEQPVDVILEFPGVECIVPHTQIDNVPEFWIQLYYCGHEVYCDSTNISASQVLYSEQVRGYPKARLIKLSCELFGLAGHYVVKLRPVDPVAAIVTSTAYIKVNKFIQIHILSFISPLFCLFTGRLE